MTKTPFQKEQMHRIAYTELSEAQVGAALQSTRAGPSSVSALSESLAGRSLRIVTDDGPELRYSFSSVGKLTLREGARVPISTGYGALTLDHVTVFSHTIPDTLRGYTVIIDQLTRLVTVFEVWFGGAVWVSGYGAKAETLSIPREVQREIYFGYVDEAGSPAPLARMQRTNRVEGRGYHWTQDTGIETLEFFPSISYSNFVELSRFGGEMSYCAPSDYIKLDDNFYIYQRTECEFSGVMTLYVIDSNRVEQIGVRLGFDENDRLHYYMFKGTGEWLGQMAHFEPFDDMSGATLPSGPNGEKPPKGARRVFRPKRTFDAMTRAQTLEAARKSTVPFEPTHLTANSQKTSDYLVGKTFTLRWDDAVAVDYRIQSIDTLSWRVNGGAWQEDMYRAWESAPDLIFFSHLLTGAPDLDCYVVVADFAQGLTTMLHGTMGTAYVGNEASVRTVFGIIEADGIIPPKKRRHTKTDEIVGRALTWNYQPGLTSMHLYSTPTSVSWIIFDDNNAGGMEWSGAASYVKIRDGIFLAYWLEEASGSPLGTLLINMKTMHDCGVTYSCHTNGLRLSPLGAFSRHTGDFDIRRFYNVSSDGGHLAPQ